MADANQEARLTTGEDTRKKRGLAAKATQPNKKRDSGHLWSNIFVLAFIIAGLVLTLQDQVRGDQQAFKLAFSVAIGITGAEIFLNIILMVLTGRKNSEGEDNGCCRKCGANCVTALISITYLVGCCVAFGFLVWALVSSKGIELDGVYGCANGFGCANIMAIIASIVYGLRVLTIAICLPCIICAGICACSACCVAAAASDHAVEGGEQAAAAQNTNL